jgi:hypothetical protein
MRQRNAPHPETETRKLASECVRCGMRQSSWFENNGQGVEKDGATYCSTLCAFDDDDIPAVQPGMKI